jgi:hypothetical protein
MRNPELLEDYFPLKAKTTVGGKVASGGPDLQEIHALSFYNYLLFLKGFPLTEFEYFAGGHAGLQSRSYERDWFYSGTGKYVNSASSSKGTMSDSQKSDKSGSKSTKDQSIKSSANENTAQPATPGNSKATATSSSGWGKAGGKPINSQQSSTTNKPKGSGRRSLRNRGKDSDSKVESKSVSKSNKFNNNNSNVIGGRQSPFFHAIVKAENGSDILQIVSITTGLNFSLSFVATHYTPRNESVSAEVFIGDKAYNDIKSTIPSSYQSFYNLQTKGMVESLYRPDIDIYGYGFPFKDIV